MNPKSRQPALPAKKRGNRFLFICYAKAKLLRSTQGGESRSPLRIPHRVKLAGTATRQLDLFRPEVIARLKYGDVGHALPSHVPSVWVTILFICICLIFALIVL